MGRISKYPFIALVLVGMVSPKLFGQSKNNVSSFYSAFGIGLLEQSRSPQSEGLGIYGVAFDQIRSVNLSNPALLSSYSFTTGTGSFSQESYTASQNNSNSSYSNFTFNGVGIIFPINKGKLATSISLTPLSYMNFYGIQKSTIPGDTLSVISELKGKGGLNTIDVGLGYSITPNFSVGYKPSFAFGSIKQTNTTLFEDLSYRTTSTGTNDYYSGIYHQIGLSFFQHSLFNDKDRALVGLTVRLPATLTINRYENNTLVNNQFEQPIGAKLGDYSMNYPMSINVGATYYFNNKYLLSSDVVYENWSEYKPITPSSDLTYINRIRVGLGGMYLPELRTSTGLFSSISLKLGASYDTGYLKIKNTSITKLAFHTGFTIPSPFIGSSVDFNIEYGILGTQSNALVKEDVLTFKFIINLSEFMFFRRQIQ